MGETTFKITVGLYLRGADLDPTAINGILGTEPDVSQRRGERQLGKKTGREYVRNIGLWALKAKPQPESNRLADYLDELLSRINFDHPAISKISGLEEAYVDIFIARRADESGDGITECEMTPQQLKKLSRIGIPIRFTIEVISVK